MTSPQIEIGAEILSRRGADQRLTEERPAARRRREKDRAYHADGEAPEEALAEPDEARTRTHRQAQGTATPAQVATMREELAGARRVVVKVGSSSLTTTEGGIDPQRMEKLVGVLARTRLAGREIVLVSSGAIAAGLSPLGLKARPRDLATQQAAASVGQGLLMGYTQLFGVRAWGGSGPAHGR